MALVGFTGANPGFGQGGAQLLRPKVAHVVKCSHASSGAICDWGPGPA